MENQEDSGELPRSILAKLKKMEKNVIGTIIRSINLDAALVSKNHLANYLTPDLCDKIFQQLLVEMERNPQINKIEYRMKIPFLLNASTKFLDLDAFLPERPPIYRDAKKYLKNDEIIILKWVIDTAKQHAPNIEHIVFNSRDIDLQKAKQLTLLDHLADLKHLKILEMKRISVVTAQLTKLCRSMPKLQILYIYGLGRLGIKVTLADIKQSLGNLRLLVCVTNENEKRKIQQQLPHLNIALHPKHEYESTFHPYTFEDFLVSETDKRTPGPRKYFSCGNDWFKSPVMDIHVTHPDVTYLEIQYQFAENISTAEQMPKFSKIRTLIALNAKNESELLRLYGHELRTLSLESLNSQSFDGQILELCPNLETIHLFRVAFDGTSLQLEKIPNLKGLFLNDTGYKRGSFLPKILSSPHLRKIEIFDVLYQEDLAALNTLVTDNQILQELETLNVFIYADDFDPDTFKELILFFENVSAFLPKLKDVQFFSDGIEYVDFANRMKSSNFYPRCKIRKLIVKNKTLVPILESYRQRRT